MEKVKKQGMESFFCPYELALELKELGFDEKCIGLWQSKYNSVPYLNINSVENIDTLLSGKIHNEDVNYIVKSPLWQQAFDWFMNNYKLFPKIDQYYGERFYVNIEDMNFPSLYSSDKLRDLGEYSSYEEARLECLKKLIEIVKNDK